MYKVEGISKIFWQVSKSFEYDTFLELKKHLNERFQLYTGCSLNYNEQVIAEFAVEALGAFIESGLCRAHQIRDLHLRCVLEDAVMKDVYGPDRRSINEKFITGVLSMFANTAVFDSHGNRQVLYDY